MGLFAGKNDFDYFHETQQARDVNRHNYSLDEVDQQFQRPVVQELVRLMKLRNAHPAFQGNFVLLDTDPYTLGQRWEKGDDFAELVVDFRTFDYTIRYTENGSVKTF